MGASSASSHRCCWGRMWRVGALGWLMLCAVEVVLSQTTGQTIRHHKIAVEDTTVPPEQMQAEAAIEKKDYATAEPLLQKVVANDPSNYAAWFDLGFLYNAEGKTEESIAAYRKSIAAKPDVFESNLNLGLMLAKAGQTDAESYLRAATRLKPATQSQEAVAQAWMSLGHVLSSKNPEQAIEAYRQAAVLQPRNADAHLAAGRLLAGENQFSDALAEYKQALTADPTSADALTGMANIYIRGQQFGEAEDTLRKLVALHPDDPASHRQLARVLAAAGHNEDAISELQTALKLDPKDSTSQLDLADVYVTAKKYPEAEAQYRALLAATPNNAELHQSLGQALLKERKFPDAQAEFLAAIKIKPDLGSAYGDLAIAANENKNYELTIKALDARAKLLPEIPVGYFLRATAYDHLRAYKEAAVNYHQFLQVANGQYPDQEWQARHRLIAIEPKK